MPVRPIVALPLHRWWVPLLALAALLPWGPGQAAAPRPRPARSVHFLIGFPPSRDTFVVRMVDRRKIRRARAILAGRERDETHVGGRIVKEPAPYNPGWSYHLDPATVDFFGVSAEIYDASPRYVEEHLDEVGGELLPDNWWWPWQSKLLRELRRGEVGSGFPLPLTWPLVPAP
jgi:hypothetical protein